jgi:hypothetical protein
MYKFGKSRRRNNVMNNFDSISAYGMAMRRSAEKLKLQDASETTPGNVKTVPQTAAVRRLLVADLMAPLGEPSDARSLKAERFMP